MVWFLQECQTSKESYSRNSKSNERGPTMCFLGSLSENEKVLLILNSNLLLQYTQCIQLNCCAHFFIFCYISRLLWFFKQINLQLVDFVPTVTDFGVTYWISKNKKVQNWPTLLYWKEKYVACHSFVPGYSMYLYLGIQQQEGKKNINYICFGLKFTLAVCVN